MSDDDFLNVVWKKRGLCLKVKYCLILDRVLNEVKKNVCILEGCYCKFMDGWNLLRCDVCLYLYVRK